LTYETFLDCVHPEDRQYVNTEWKASVAGKPYDIEHRLLIGGETKWVREKAELEFNEDGGCLRGTGFAQDITERKSAETALRESENRYRDLIELNPDCIFVCRHGVILYTNNAMVEILGAGSKEDLIGRSIFDFVHPDYRKKARERSQFVTEKKMPVPLSDFILLRMDDGQIHVQSLGAPVEFEGKAAVLYATRDVTALKKVMEEKSQLEKQLQQAQKMESIGNLAGGIAHDFNNILFPIVGMAELLLEDLPAESLEYQNAREILKAGKRGSDLVKQILAFSRQTEHQMIPIRIQSILKEVIKLGKASIPADIKIVSDIQRDCGLILADPVQIHQIAMNLITNAYHAMEQTGGEIAVRLQETRVGGTDTDDLTLAPGQYATLIVADTGSGIDPVVMDKIFEPYFTTKEQGKGTGLGLAVVFGIVKEHSGEIKVHSAVGRGTTFTVLLPLLDKSPESRPEKEVETFEPGTERILLVDDEEAICHMLKQMLARLGYRVTTRLSGVEALDVFRTEPNAFDLVITDMTMPNLTGDQLARELISIKADTPIVICTGFSERMDKDKADAIGIKG
ncbi:MAG: PAS domain S-box protein, partial [Desulfobacterales bacterium]|nr:PAS domain S-box protein [Desulfobacterales bacterium]